MSNLLDRVVTALRRQHDTLAAIVPTLDEEGLARRSGASEWTVAQVLSHLGSGAEITVKPIRRAAGHEVDAEDNQAVWARWDGAAPADQAAGFLSHDAAYLETVEGLPPEQRSTLSVDLGFLPEPVPLVVALGMRLNEVANHAWDVQVALDPAAEVDPDAAEVLLDLFAGPLAFLLGFSGKPDQAPEAVRLAVPGGGVIVDGGVSVVRDLEDPTASLSAPAGATIRLLAGRLGDEHADGVTVTGNVTLTELRRIFPGY